MKNIVILGGSFAGVSTAHRILKQAGKTGPFKITLVSSNTHVYWNIAAPRGFVPEELTDDQLFQEIVPGFSKIPADQFEFIQASATKLDVDAKHVQLNGPNGHRTLNYDFLILATGSRTKDGAPYKPLSTTEETKKALHDYQARVKGAQSIVIAGAGVTGCEIAGELAYEYGRQKKITLIASGLAVLDQAPPSVSKVAAKEMSNLNIDIKLQTKVKSSVRLPSGQLELTFSNGETLVTDLYIPTFGLLPNSSYIPAAYLDSNGFVLVDNYLKVKGTKDIWAIGDVSATEPSQLIYCDRQSTHLSNNMVLILNNKPPLPYKSSSTPFIGFQIGKKSGTGQFGGYRVPTFVIVWARKTLFIERLPRLVDGSLF